MATIATEILSIDTEVLEDIADAVHALWLTGRLATHSTFGQSIQFRVFEEALRRTIHRRKLDAERDQQEESA